MEIISSGEIGTRYSMGEQRAAVAAARKQHPMVYLTNHCLLAKRWREEPECGAWPYCGEPFFFWPPWYSSLLLHVLYELRTNICRWNWHNDKDDAYRWWRTYPSNIQRIHGGFKLSKHQDTPLASVNWPCSQLGAQQQFAKWVDFEWMELSWMELSWMELSWMELSWMELSWMELSWMELSWMELSWMEFSWMELGWMEFSWMELSWAELSWAELSWTELS